ncbi:MAG: glycosyltransferase [Acidobacteriaceae bacterium]|nr:glycosyltransferase [Acidobacteriaceae bacterium]
MVKTVEEVWVLTRSNNKDPIERDPRSRNPNLHFIYFDLPQPLRALKKKIPGFLYLYVYLWQRGAFRVAQAQQQKTPFDAVFYVTFSGMMTGCPLGKLGLPFIVGPVAGGEVAPSGIMHSLPLRFRLFEAVRRLGISVQRISPITQQAYDRASHIFVTSRESLQLISPQKRHKASILLSVGLSPSDLALPMSERPNTPKFVCIARLLHWKGIHLAIKAFAQVVSVLPDASLDILGTGPHKDWLHSVAVKCGVENKVHFMGHMDRQASMDYLKLCTALVFPSMHDSGGMAVLESLARGTPVICLDLGGPGTMIDNSCGYKLETANRHEGAIVQEIAQAMQMFNHMSDAEYNAYAMGARDRAAQLTWTRLHNSIFEQSGLVTTLKIPDSE